MARGRLSRAAKAKARKLLGPLRRRTVAPQTRVLYDRAMQLFSFWLKSERKRWPDKESELGLLLTDFAEVLWEEGESKADLANLLSALHDAEPSVDPFLRAAWRLYHVWKKNELAEQCTPARQEWVQALCGLALHWNWFEIALVLILSFELLLRTSEAANLKHGDIVFTKRDVALIKLGFTKGGLRKGRKEAVVLDKEVLVRWLKAIHEPANPGKLIISGGAKELRRRFGLLVKGLGLTHLNLKYYSLRRGGATELFTKTGSFDICAEAGRWENIRTARIYIDGALQQRYAMEVTESIQRRLNKARRVFEDLIQ